MKFELKDKYIELFKLIKVMDLTSSGGEAKMLIENRLVKRGGQVELRKRAKILAGETIEVDGDIIEVI